MNILVQLSHPAHYHSFKIAMNRLREDGHNVYYLIKTKDILEELLKSANEEYYNILPIAHRKSKFGVLMDMCIRDWRILRFVHSHKIDCLIGSTPEVAQIGWLTGKFALNVGEDDAHIVKAFIKVAGPFINTLVVPTSCNMDPLKLKTIFYPGFQKLAYLHPNYFQADKEVVLRNGICVGKPFFILRFASLNAHHDNGISGINTEIAQNLIKILSSYGNIYITSERKLEPQFEKYRLHINPLDIHHIMSFATLYIGDSQSMANEAAMLGTPSLRFNDFVGDKKIGVMEELEHSYGLTFGISSHEPEKLYAKVQELLSMPNLREEFQKRRQKMLADKIDVTAFLTWFVENYPNSVKQAKGQKPDSEFWKQFK